jgi:hypothetical protein
MKTPIQLYKDFVDGLVKGRAGVLGRWITGRGWPDSPENKPINELLAQLTPQQKEIVAQIAKEAREEGIHDTLAYLDDEMANGLRLVNEGAELPISPFESLHYDWVCRCAGDAWPDERKKV